MGKRGAPERRLARWAAGPGLGAIRGAECGMASGRERAEDGGDAEKLKLGKAKVEMGWRKPEDRGQKAEVRTAAKRREGFYSKSNWGRPVAGPEAAFNGVGFVASGGEREARRTCRQSCGCWATPAQRVRLSQGEAAAPIALFSVTAAASRSSLCNSNRSCPFLSRAPSRVSRLNARANQLRHPRGTFCPQTLDSRL